MRLYRVFPYRPGAGEGEPGHATFVPSAQGAGRLDNPDHYTVRYFAEAPVSAVAERFGDIIVWHPEMFYAPAVRGSYALATFELSATARILDLDDAKVLLDRGLRPTQVARRDVEVTQRWALDIWSERQRSRPRWDGVRWWSWYRPEWPMVGVWGSDAELLDVTPLGLDHPSVREAIDALMREVTR